MVSKGAVLGGVWGVGSIPMYSRLTMPPEVTTGEKILANTLGLPTSLALKLGFHFHHIVPGSILVGSVLGYGIEKAIKAVR